MVPPSLPLLLLLLPPPQAAMPNAATAAVNPTTATFRSFLTLFPPVSFAAPVGIVPAPTGSDISALKPSQAAQQGRNTGISPTPVCGWASTAHYLILVRRIGQRAQRSAQLL